MWIGIILGKKPYKILATNKDYLFSKSGLSVANFKVISWNMFFPGYLLEF